MNFVHPSRLQRIQQDSNDAPRHQPEHHHHHQHQHHQHHHQHQGPQQSKDDIASEAAFSQVGRSALPAQDAQFQENGSTASSRGGRRAHGGDVGPLPAVHAIVAGAVHSVQSFGAFIAMDGFSKHGLVHVSQLADRRVEQASDVVAVGQRVFVKVLAVSPDDGKLSLSMKLVDQRSGRDLDSSHQEAVRYGEGGGRAHSRPVPLQLDAVLNTTCSRCGRPGHLSNDCWMGRDDAKYDLIGSDDEDVRKVTLLQSAAAARASEKRVRSAMRAAAREERRAKREHQREHKRKSKHRHHRHHKHKSKRKHRSSSPPSSSSSSSLSSSSSSSSSRHSHSRSRRDRRDRDESKRSRSRSPRERRRSRSPRHHRERSRSPVSSHRDSHRDHR